MTDDFFPDCDVRSDVRCLDDRMGRRCACAFVTGHDGPHFCKWCRKKILGVVDDRVDLPLRPGVRSTDPDTSEAAATSMTEAAKSQRRAILVFLEYVGDRGAVHSEIDEALQWDAHTANRRLCELRRLGLVIRTDRKRPTHSGRLAYVYELAPAVVR